MASRAQAQGLDLFHLRGLPSYAYDVLPLTLLRAQVASYQRAVPAAERQHTIRACSSAKRGTVLRLAAAPLARC